MVMTEAEIVQSYRQAKKQDKQIQILAELNQCTLNEIVAILDNAGELNNLPEPKNSVDSQMLKLFQQGYSNPEVARILNLTPAQVANKKCCLKKQGFIVYKLHTADKDNMMLPAGSEKPLFTDRISRVMSLLSDFAGISGTEVLAVSIKLTDDNGKSWRLDLQDENGENSL